MRILLILCALLCSSAYAFDQQQDPFSKSLTFQFTLNDGAALSFQKKTGATTDLLLGSSISVFSYTRESPAYSQIGADWPPIWEQGTRRTENRRTKIGLWIGQRHYRHRGTGTPYFGYGIGPLFKYTKINHETHFPSDTPQTFSWPSEPRHSYGFGVNGFGSIGIVYKIRDNIAFQGDYSLVYSDDGIIHRGNSVDNRITFESWSSVGIVLFW